MGHARGVGCAYLHAHSRLGLGRSPRGSWRGAAKRPLVDGVASKAAAKRPPRREECTRESVAETRSNGPSGQEQAIIRWNLTLFAGDRSDGYVIEVAIAEDHKLINGSGHDE